jgi:hypothetical protein
MDNKPCQWCEEPIEEDDGADQFELIQMHQECALRAALGSVAHIERRCSCFVVGATETDPPGMTRREAARAAFAAWKERGVEPPRY